MKSQSSIRKSLQREMILETLRSIKSHPTADELFKILREKLPHISLATVYRNLEFMTEEGVIRKVASGEREMRFDGDITKHYHMRCKNCGKPFDLPFSLKISLAEICPNADEYGITDMKVEFEFLCDICNRNCSNETFFTNRFDSIEVVNIPSNPAGVVE